MFFDVLISIFNVDSVCLVIGNGEKMFHAFTDPYSIVCFSKLVFGLGSMYRGRCHMCINNDCALAGSIGIMEIWTIMFTILNQVIQHGISSQLLAIVDRIVNLIFLHYQTTVQMSV